MPDFGPNDPLTAAIAGRGGLYNLSTATQPGQGALDRPTHAESAPNPFNQLESRRQYLLGQLPYANSRGIHQINSELRGINSIYRQQQYEEHQAESQRRFEATQRRLMAHDQAEMASHALKLDRETSIDEQGANLMTGLGQLDALHRSGRIGTEQYDAALLDLGQQNLLGLRHPVAGKMYEHFITESDRRNQFALRRNASEAARLAGRYGVDVQTDETGAPSIEATKIAALMSDRGRAEQVHQMNQEMFNKYGVPTGVSSLFNPIEPHTDAEGGKINLPFLNKGKVEHLAVPKPLFEQMKSDFNDRYFAIVPQQQSQQQAPVQSGLQVGTQRTVGGKNYSWNGTRWEPQ